MNIDEFKSGDIVSVGLSADGMFAFGDLSSLPNRACGTVFINPNASPKSFISFEEKPSEICDLHCRTITKMDRSIYNIPSEFKFGMTLANSVQAEINNKKTVGDFIDGEIIELALNKNKCPVWELNAKSVKSYIKTKVHRLPEETYIILTFDDDTKDKLNTAWYTSIDKNIRNKYKIDPQYKYYTTIAPGLIARSFASVVGDVTKKTNNKSSIPIIFLLGAAGAIISTSINKNNNREQASKLQ